MNANLDNNSSSKKPWAIIKCVLLALLYMGIQIVVTYAFLFGAIALGSTLNDAVQFTVDNVMAETVISIAILACALLIPHRVSGKPSWRPELKMFGPNRTGKASSIIPAVGITFFLTMTFDIVGAYLLPGFEFENSQMLDAGTTYLMGFSPALGMIISIVVVCIVAPFGEELLFRRTMIPILERRFGTTAAVIISALLFGCAHLSSGGVLLVAFTFVMGVFLGLIYVRTGSFWLAVAGHCLANFSNVPTSLLASTEIELWPFGVASAVLLIVCTVLFFKITREKNGADASAAEGAEAQSDQATPTNKAN